MNNVDITQVLFDVDKKFSAIKSEITKRELSIGISECLEQHQICFSYNDVMDKSCSKFDTIPKNKKGIYLFEGKYSHNSADNWNEFKKKWKTVKATTPNIVEARFASHSHDFSTDTYIPLYAGAATKCIRERILQHVFAEKKNGFLKSTSALRLHQHIQQDVVFNLEYKVKYVEINIAKELFPILENRIREYRNCIIGKNS